MSEYVPVTRTGPVRIGDAERDQAVSALGDHFAAGRITREEFDERSDQAVRARFAADLAPLFADLPDPEPAQTSRRPQQWGPGFRPGPPPPFFLLAPLLVVGLVVTAVILTAPWILWLLFAFALFGGGPRHRHWHHRHHPRR